MSERQSRAARLALRRFAASLQPDSRDALTRVTRKTLKRLGRRLVAERRAEEAANS